MSRSLSTLMFIAVSLFVIVGIHTYLWLRLVRDPGLPGPWRGLVTVALIALSASLPLSFVVARFVPPPFSHYLALPAYLWMGLMFLLLVGVLLGDAVKLVAFVAFGPVSPERRQFLSRVVGSGVTILVGGAAVAAVRSALGPVQVKTVHVPLARLPQSMAGTTLVQLTDVHIGPTLGPEFLERIVKTTNELAPDVVVITGDLVDGSVELLRESVAPLAKLRARYGSFFVTGNHEYYSGAVEWIAEIQRLGIRVLANEHVTIGGDTGFQLAGINDYTGRMIGSGPDLERALRGRNPEQALGLLAHQPRAIHEAARQGVGLQLSGHTHGGQIWPFTYMVRLQQPFVCGLTKVNDTILYVSRGTGFWGPPMRLGAPAEITRIVLSSSHS